MSIVTRAEHELLKRMPLPVSSANKALTYRNIQCLKHRDNATLCALIYRRSESFLTPLSAPAFLCFCPAGSVSCSIAFFPQSLTTSLKVVSFRSSVLRRCICLTFYGSSKGCKSPEFRGICRMRLIVKKRKSV